MGCPSPAAGVFGKLLIESGLVGTGYTFDADSERYEFMPPHTVGKIGRLIGGTGIWGGLYPLSTRARTGHEFFYGVWKLNPSAGYFSTLLPYLVGTEDQTTPGLFVPSDCPNPFGLLCYRDLESGTTLSFEYQDCRVAWWEIESRAAQFREGEGIDEDAPDLLTLTMFIIAMQETFTAWPATEPDLPEGDEYYPYAIHDGTYTLESDTRDIFGFKLRYDNRLQPVYAHSLTPIGVVPRGRRITLDVELPWTADNIDLYNAGYAGDTAVIALALPGNEGTTDITISNLKSPPRSPVIPSDGPIPLVLQGMGFGLAADQDTTKEFKVENDTSPA